ncbi:histidine--tRNA ligase [Patescibacteria group bacterium]
MNAQTLKGFRDIGPDEMLQRKEILAKTEEIVKKYGFLPLETPALEQADLLLGKYGSEEKLIYKFRDQGDREIALRYDLTVPLARFVENNKGQLNFPFKRYQIGQAWRTEKPQKGRFREFLQFDTDIVGSSDPTSDAEILAMISEWLDSFDLKFQIKVNDRKILDDALDSIDASKEDRKKISIAIDKLDKIGFEEVKKELEGIKNISALMEFLKWNKGDIDSFAKLVNNKNVTKNLKEIIRQAKKLGAKNIVFDPRIIRGLDYYTSTIFEATISDYENVGSVTGGGRYDKMISELASGNYPAVGTSFGIDRIAEVLKESKKLEMKTQSTQIVILNIDEKLINDYLEIVKKLRDKNINCELIYSTEKISKQLSKVSKKNIPFVLIYGSQEKQKDIFVLRDMQKNQQKEYKNLEEIIKHWYK